MDEKTTRGGSEDLKATNKRSWGRRLALASLLLLAVIGVATWALPRLAGTAVVRSAIAVRVNRALAPSRVEVAGLSASWFGTLRATGLKFTDGQGKTIIAADAAELDRGLAALFIDPSRLGTLTVDGAKIDIERRADGSIDLVEALTPPPAPTPGNAPAAGGRKPIDVTLKVVRSAVVLRSPELVEPITADRAELTIRLPAAADKKLGWQVALASPPGGKAEQTLTLDGDFDHRAADSPDTSLRIVGKDWPLAVTVGGLAARGRLDGEIRLGRTTGHWAAAGEANVLNLDAEGPALAGDRLRLDAVKGSWDLAEDNGAWAIRRLSVDCPVASIGATATIGGDRATATDAHLEGRIDLAALAKLIPRALRLREGIALDRGEARVVLNVKTTGEAQEGTFEANLSDLAGREGIRAFTLAAPATLVARGRRSTAGISVETLELKSAFAALKGSGDMDRGVTLSGTFDLAAVQTQFRQLIDFGNVGLAGKGKLAADYRRDKGRFAGRSVVEIQGLNVAGLTSSPYAREVLRLEADASGPADSLGLPTSWADFRGKFHTPFELVNVTAKAQEGATNWKGTASLPAVLPQRAGRAGAEFAGRWTASSAATGRGVIDVEELRLNLQPDDPALIPAGVMRAAFRGRLDLDADELTVTPLPLRPGEKAPAALGDHGMKVRGLLKNPSSPESAEVDVRGDLTAIDVFLKVWTGGVGSGLTGPAGARFIAEPENGRLKLRLAAQAPTALSGQPVELAFGGVYEPAADRLECRSITVATPYARIEAAGQVAEATTRRVADLSGTLSPDWKNLTAIVEKAVEAEARVEGRPRPFHVKGPLAGGSLAAIVKGMEDAEIGVDVTSANVFGLAMSEAPLVVRCKGGTLTMDPFRTTVNEGFVDVKPGLSVDDAQGIAVLLHQGTALAGVKINDEVSRRVLTYIAPVLDRATHVSGTIAADVKGEIPITGPASRTTTLDGHLAFQNVVFAPGPSAAEILSVVGRGDAQGIRLQQPLQLSIAGRRVHQDGLKITVRKGVDIGLRGSVGFDKTLAMQAKVPLTKAMLGSRVPAELGDALKDNEVTIPIGGTVSRPAIDRRALRVALGDLSKGALKQGLQKEASKLLDRLGPAPAAGAARGPGAKRSGGTAGALEELENNLLKRVLPGGKP